MAGFPKHHGSILIAVIYSSILMFFGFVVANMAMQANSEDYGPPYRIGAIAVGHGYSINIDAKPIHPFLAEYDQWVSIYGGHPRVGEHLGTLKIPTNTGGRVRIGVFVPKDLRKPEIVLLQRHYLTRINLKTRKIAGKEFLGIEEREQSSAWKDPTLKFLGWISGESSPVKFIPCAVWPSLSDEEKGYIVSGEATLLDLCETHG